MDSAVDPAKLLLEAVDKGDYKLAAAAALVVLVWLLRQQVLAKISPEKLIKLGILGDIIGWLTSTAKGGMVMSVAAGTLGAVATALIAHEAITRHLVLSALIVSAAGSGMFSWLQALKPKKKDVADGGAA